MAEKRCDMFCANCVYSSKNGDGYTICNYLLITGKMRRCDPGKGCKRKVTTRMKRWAKKGENNG